MHYINDSLWDVESPQKDRVANMGRVRGTVDIDFGELTHLQGLSFHATAVWQAGGNLGSSLGLIANPTGLASMNTFRLDSWWFEKRWLNSHLATRVGQFAGQDSYGHQNFGKSFMFEPLNAALDNLSNDFESFDPPSTSAFEVRVVPMRNIYVKSMVLAEDRSPFANNTTGLVPQFRGTPVSVSEIGFTPGKKPLPIVPADNVGSRKGYSGLYQFGASYDPGKFTVGTSTIRQPGNYLLYWIANQALWRPDPKESKGLDATLGYDWSPPVVNRNNRTLTAGLRLNEPLPLKFHNTLSFGYVQNSLSPQFLTPGNLSWKMERGIELSVLLHVLPMMYFMPVVQYYSNVAGQQGRVVVVGFRTKIEL